MTLNVSTPLASSSITPTPTSARSSGPLPNLPPSAHTLDALKRPIPRREQRPRYIAVAGNIGVGKSSLVEFLCKRYDFVPFFEPNDANPYLDDFYRDMNRYAFHSQLYFLATKYRLHQAMAASPHHVIQDRTIWEDAEIFVENLHRLGIMDHRDYSTYRNLYESMHAALRPPDLMIYLHSDLRTVQRRIVTRGRAMEQDIPLDYLNRLQDLYDAWIQNYTLSPLITFRTDRLDYITDLVHCHKVLTTIERYL